MSHSFVPREETGTFSVKDINIAKNIKIPTVYWFANINNNCMMWTCWNNDLSNILRRVIISTSVYFTSIIYLNLLIY